jgi:aconitate hydratase
MGVLPLTFKAGESYKSLSLKGNEQIDILGIDSKIQPNQDLRCVISKPDGIKQEITLCLGIYTSNEIEYFKHGGILKFVLNQIVG